MSVHCQTNDSIEQIGISIADEMPASCNEIMCIVQDCLQYPKKRLSDSISGIVLVSFWVDTNGNTYNHKVEKGISPEFNNEALRVCRLLKFENPAYSNGIPVQIQYTLPVNFSVATDRKRPQRRSLNK